MKIYTKTGDKGTTSLFGGQRVSKADERIASYGTVDELNAVLGICLSILPDYPAVTSELTPWLERIQHDLFSIGSHLATPPEQISSLAVLPPLPTATITELEQHIDQLTSTLPELKNFILPGGSKLSAQLHLARTICRRAERLVVQLPQTEPMIQYLNRLSDWFFVVARWSNAQLGYADQVWKKP